MPESAPPILDVQGLGHALDGRTVLHDVALALAPGRFQVLLGPNGAGKTTLFALLTRLYAARSGTIRIAGAELRERPLAALAAMGVVFQSPTLDLDLTVRRNLAYQAALAGLSRRVARERIAAELERFGMAGAADRPARTLSGGERRRVEIARALLHRPRLLLLDEPTVGLDIASRRALVEHAHALATREGVAVLWATHLIDEVGEGDDVVVLDAGRVRAQGTVSEVVADCGAGDIAEAYAKLTTAEAPA